MQESGGGGEGDEYWEKYLTFTFSSNGTIGINHGSSSPNVTVFYKKNDSAWVQYTLGTMLTVNSGDVIKWKGNNPQYASSTLTNYKNNFSGSASFEAYGNIMSLTNGDDFKTASALTANYTFTALFSASSVTSVENLVLPAETITINCYTRMFQACTSLTTPMEVLPSMSLAKQCYLQMFMNCSNLTAAPTLPSTTVTDGGYQQMFYGCSRLNYVKCLALTLATSTSTDYWLHNVASSGTFVKNANKTDWSRDASGIPANWTVQNATS